MKNVYAVGPIASQTAYIMLRGLWGCLLARQRRFVATNQHGKFSAVCLFEDMGTGDFSLRYVGVAHHELRGRVRGGQLDAAGVVGGERDRAVHRLSVLHDNQRLRTRFELLSAVRGGDSDHFVKWIGNGKYGK